MQGATIKFEGKLTSASFFEKIVPQLNAFAVQKSKEKVTFDFSEIIAINFVALSYVLSEAEKIKIATQQKVNFCFPPIWELQNLSRYLLSVDFFTMANKLDLFDYQHSIGSIHHKYDGIEKQCFSVFRKPGNCEEGFYGKIWQPFFEESDKEKKALLALLKRNDELGYKDVFEELRTISFNKTIIRAKDELFDNSNDYGGATGYCFGNYIKKWRTLYICFCDTGKGLDFKRMQDRSDSGNLLNKFLNIYGKPKQKTLIFKQNSKKYFADAILDENCKKILEALFFRRHESSYNGIYGILAKLAKYKETNEDRKVVFRFHSDRCKIRIADYKLLKLCSDKANEIADSEFADYAYRILKDEDSFDICRTNRLDGVHIEMEIGY